MFSVLEYSAITSSSSHFPPPPPLSSTPERNHSILDPYRRGSHPLGPPPPLPPSASPRLRYGSLGLAPPPPLPGQPSNYDNLHRPPAPTHHHSYAHSPLNPHHAQQSSPYAPPPPSNSPRARLQLQQRLQRHGTAPGAVDTLALTQRSNSAGASSSASSRAKTPPRPTGRCNLCERTRTQLTCAGCVRDKLYPRRYESVAVVIDRDDAGSAINEHLSGSSNYGACLEAKHEEEELRSRITDIQGYADGLRREMAEYSERIAKLRAANMEKKEQLKEARNVAQQQNDKAVHDVKRDTRKKNQSWNMVHDRTGEARVFLCREAASLHSLKQRRRKRGIDYMINGVVIPDIRQLNHINPTNLTVSLGHLAHLTVLVASYLGLKLPCEVQLPQKDSPHPSIRISSKSRPRELNIEVPLLQLSSSDSNRYALFIEGVSMLAYNVSWMCWSQGVEEVVGEVEDAWQPGRNLYYLLLATPTKTVPAAVGAADIPLTADPTNPTLAPPPVKMKTANMNTMFGMVNHACAKDFLGSAKGYEHMARWKVNLAMLMDRTKFLLLGESTAAEWDLIEDEALEEDPNVANEAGGVVTKGIMISSPRTGTVTPNKGVSVTGSPSRVHANGSPARGSSPAFKTRSAVNGGKDVSGGWTKLARREG